MEVKEGAGSQIACTPSSLSINFSSALPSDRDSFPNMGLTAFWVILSVCDKVSWILMAS